MRKEVENWWKQAEADLRTASNSFNSGDYYACVFWSQQAVEKALKALYLKRFNELPKIHDLTIFAKKLDLSSNLYENCEDLTNVYTETRYPDMSDIIPAKKFTKEEATEFLEKAKEVIKWIKENI